VEIVLPPTGYSATAFWSPHLSPGFLAGFDPDGPLSRLAHTNMAGEPAPLREGGRIGV
jgi:hypothetical protein